ncbi:MAG: holo-ACP synthase [Coriobacteriales bacterium]
MNVEETQGLHEAPQAQPAVPIAGLGVDIVEIPRMEAILQRSPAFERKVFTEGERAYCSKKHNPAVHYATHFAAKEAVVKALGTGFGSGVGFQDVEVTHNERGKPVVLLHNRARQIADEMGILEIPISLSRTHGTAVANAIATREDTKPAPPEEKSDSKRQIASAFKELRGMLDELDAPTAAEPEAGKDA